MTAAPATSAPTGVDFLTYYGAVQKLADLLRRVNQFSTLCHHYLERDTGDPGTSNLSSDLEQALLVLNGDLDHIGQATVDSGILDTAGNPIVPSGYTVVDGQGGALPELTRTREAAP